MRYAGCTSSPRLLARATSPLPNRRSILIVVWSAAEWTRQIQDALQLLEAISVTGRASPDQSRHLRAHLTTMQRALEEIGMVRAVDAKAATDLVAAADLLRTKHSMLALTLPDVPSAEAVAMMSCLSDEIAPLVAHLLRRPEDAGAVVSSPTDAKSDGTEVKPIEGSERRRPKPKVADYRGQIFDGWKIHTKFYGNKTSNNWVFKARHDEIGDGALKMLNPVRLADGRDRASLVKRLRDEAAALNKCVNLGIAGVLPIFHASFPARPTPTEPAFIVVGWSQDLTKAFSGQPALPDVVGAYAALAQTLAELHSAGIVHRDIKPANLFCFRGRWCFGDFGLVKYREKEQYTREGGKALGSLGFIAPELQQEPRPADVRPADVWALAKSMWVSATERDPFEREYSPAVSRRIG